jgi:GntR family transcriptional regulator
MAATKEFIDHRLPLYQRIADELRLRISAGEWKPGQLVPTESQLVAQFNVAVGTIRKAMEILEAAGLVERFRGRGTFVRRAQFDSSLFRFFRFVGPCGERIYPESQLLSRTNTQAPYDVVERLALKRGSRVIHLHRLRLIDNAPMLVEDIWLPATIFKKILEISESEIGPLLYPVYEKNCGVTVARAKETLSVTTSGVIEAGWLKIAVGSPIVVLERTAFDHSGKPIESRRSIGHAHMFRYEIDVS